jgi:hypothetical protein
LQHAERQAWNGSQQPMLAVATDKGDDRGRASAFNRHREVAALGEQRRRAAAQGKKAGDQRLLDAAIAPASGERRKVGIAECRDSCGEIDPTAVVGIDQAELPELATLVKVGGRPAP